MTNLILIIATCAVFTMLTRALPFLIFSGKREVPKTVVYLGKVLPPTIIATLVVYALRNTDLTSANVYGLPELIGVLTAGGLHYFFKNSFISIGAATVLYMVLIRIM